MGRAVKGKVAYQFWEEMGPRPQGVLYITMDEIIMDGVILFFQLDW
jgi:hypothetical protein